MIYTEAHKRHINMFLLFLHPKCCSTYLITDYQFAYYAYGVTCTETEVDVLTGETQVLRVDILYDCGER